MSLERDEGEGPCRRTLGQLRFCLQSLSPPLAAVSGVEKSRGAIPTRSDLPAFRCPLAPVQKAVTKIESPSARDI